MSTLPPEERLLRLIKGGDKKSENRAEAAGKKKNGNGPIFSGVANFMFKNSFLRSSFFVFLNRIFLVVASVLAVYIVGTFLLNQMADDYGAIDESRQSRIDAEDKKEAGDRSVGISEENMQKFLNQVQGKKVFGTVSSPYPAIASAAGDSVAKRFNLVGIVNGAQPQAIIEDAVTQKTYYIYEGQTIGGVTVKEITNGKTVLIYEGEEIALVM